MRDSLTIKRAANDIILAVIMLVLTSALMAFIFIPETIVKSYPRCQRIVLR